ncbi:hypothetical protein JD844_015229 [Phrynosoma platyrhinos]|uniref:N-alpha-acetyltransferase 25, NatB auxiliary subunit n=1 Tax=Phrynosoma platyrhinos TaxID=52577 RepID=A0ABQ7T7X7_PHRPL|nr:hypothetical protein JD844_015229 [Phrynosoma platyrhinos]
MYGFFLLFFVDYLDNGNNKMAIQQADKLLKKHKDLHCAKVLKAIGLQRTGKQDEAFTLAQEVAALEPTDDNSLQALTILYREMHRPELVTKLYEAAVKKVPNSEEYHSHLFMAYARVGEYKKMQQAGMALYKIVPKNPYYFWSVMSLIMQSISAQDEKLSKTMFLPLAERMVEKMVKEDKIEAEAETDQAVQQGIISTMNSLKNWNIRDLNTGHDGEFCLARHVSSNYAGVPEVELYYMILERLEKYQEALDVVRGKLGEKLTSELQSRENKCMEMYKKLGKWPECNALSRKLLLKNPDDWQFYMIYFDSLFQLIDTAWSPPAEEEHSLEGEVHHSTEQAVVFIEQRIIQESNSIRPLRGPYLAQLELIRRLQHRGCSEEHKLGEEPAAWQCLMLLEEGLTHSPSNAQFKLLLIRIYCILGAFEPVVELYSSLDAKHIQHDTIGYLLTRYAAAFGHYAAASQSCNFALRFFHSNQKDTSEYIIQAYKYGAFEKIPEFIAFRNRLNSSLHFAQVRTERMLLDLLLEANISASLDESIKSMSLSPEEDDIPWNDLQDNRDLTVLFNWDPKDRCISEEDKRLSLEEETIWLRIRSLTLRLISGLPALSHNAQPKNSEKNTENGVSSKIHTVRALLQQLDTAVNSGKRFLEQKIQYPVLGPPPSRMAGYFNSGSCQCQTSLFYLVSDIYELDTNGLDDSTAIQERIGNSLKSLLEQLTDQFNKCKGDLLEVREGSFKTHPNILENLVFFVETISIVLWVCSYSDTILRPCRSSLQKKKKKKKESIVAMPPVFASFQDYLSGLQTLTSNVIDHIKGLEITLAALKLEELSIEDNLLLQEEKKFTKTALGKIQNSYQHAIQEIGELLKKRLDTIKNLKV